MSLLRIVAAIAGLQAMQCAAQYAGMDLPLMEKWAKAKVIKYRVEGVHNARVPVVFGDYEGKADVIDRITVEFTWDNKKNKILAPITVTDAKSELKNIRSDGTNCPPPQLKGDYEHFQSVSNSTPAGDQLQINGTRNYPAASVSNYPASCSMRAVKAGKEDVVVWVPAGGAEALGMAIKPDAPISASADRKSFSIRGAENWVWTYTPTLVQ